MSAVTRVAVAALILVSVQEAPQLRALTWADVTPPMQRLLIARGVDAASFPGRIAALMRSNQARLREGDLDHLVYYALQSSTFTDLPPIEPALSAREFVTNGAIPAAAAARLAAFAAASDAGRGATRLRHAREILAKEKPAGASTRDFLSEEYRRAMRFLYEKEFVAARAQDRTAAVGRLYQTRGLSTDASVEAGYVVYVALATLRELEPQRRIGRVLIVGPGLDLAPRTALVEADGGAQSYQPFAVMDALLALGLSDRNDLRVTAVDINPRVVEWLDTARVRELRLTLASGVAEQAGVRFSGDFRAYFDTVGRSVGTERPARGPATPPRLMKTLDVAATARRAVSARPLDIVLERLDARFDLVVVTNVFPYLPDTDLLLALTNIARMLAPGGTLVHNEPRPILAEATHALGLQLTHSRSVVIATVEGAASPLYDAVWMHRAP